MPGALAIATMWAAVSGDAGVAVITILNAMRALLVAPLSQSTATAKRMLPDAE